MATVTVSNNTDLRTAIQNAGAVDVIQLNGTSPFSVTTLAKFVSFSPLTQVGGYTVQSASGGKRTLSNTRIYQQNIDGPYAPSNVNNVILNYSNGNNTAIFRATTGTYNFNAIDITGTHGGWAGNGSVYMSMTVSDGSNPINTNLTLSNSTVSLTGQSGFTASTGTGSVSAFMQSWNNSGSVTLSNNVFDEAGYKTSFHFASINSGGILRGVYTIAGNTFKRTSNANVRDRGNRLESVSATVAGNTFQDGSYLALGGTLSSMSLTANTFSTVLGGTGIAISGSTTGSPTLTNNSFTGYGMALTNVNTAANSVFTVAGTGNTVTAGSLASKSFGQFTAGGSGGNSISVNGADDWINGGAGNDTISSAGGNDYIIGGLGNDTINPGTGADTILYYNTNEGSDTINGFQPGTDKLAFRTGGGGATAFAAGTIFETSTPTSSAPTLSYVGGILTYDADGNGGGGAVTIATFAGSPAITAADILLF